MAKKQKLNTYDRIFGVLLCVILGIIAVFVFSSSGKAQNYLYNGNGFFENRTAETDQAMAELPGRLLIGIPGGPISKLVEPVSIPKGWGLSDAYTNEIFSQYPDEDGSSVQKWLDKENTQPNRSYLFDCNDLSAQYPGEFGFVYRFNINSTPAEAVNALSILIDGGSFVYGVVAGSEVYSWLEFDHQAYFDKAQPIIDAIHTNYPWLKVGLCIAPNTERRDHNDWNAAVYNYAVAHPEINALDVHFYDGEKSCSSTWNNMPEPRVITPGVADAELNEYFNEAYECLTASTSFTDRIATLKEQFSQMELWCMEGFTTNPSAYFGNTYLGALFQFKSLVENYSEMNIFGKQTGVSPDLYGDYSRANNYDIATGMVRRTGYYASLLGLKAMGAGAVPYTTNACLPLVEIANYYFYNLGSFGGAFLTPVDYEIDSVVVERFSAPFLYSSCGSMQYMGRGTPKQYVLTGTETDAFYTADFNVPANSFGTITVYQHRKPPVCKCEDAAAINYGEVVECGSDRPCTYPTVCYKERLIFKSWGCKIDKKCLVNNCKN